MKKFTSIITLLAMCTLPVVTNAQSTASIQQQTQTLLQQVQQLQSQIASSNGTSSTGSGATGSTSCPNIGRVLKLGSSGDDVTRLQQFLALDPAVYPEGIASGYYGGLTEAAVQRWQSKYNVVSSGTPGTTGYGVVGPRTAAAIALLCSQNGGGGSTGPVVGGYIQISPISGTAPLAVNVTAYANSTLSCAAVNYTLDFGDGSAQQVIPVASGGCQQVTQKYTHTYIYGGSYKITLAAAGHQTSAGVSVSGPAQPTNGTGGSLYPVAPINNPTNNPSSTYSNTLNVSPAAGTSPLTVTISVQGLDPNQQYALNFGDGAGATLSGGIAGQQVTHVYTNTGTFTVQLLIANSLVRATTVSVSDGGTSGTGTYSIISVTPTVNSNQITLQLSVPACSGYTVTWGDGGTTNGTAQTGCSANGAPYTPSVSHTYSGVGTYTIVLQNGAGASQSSASVTITST